MKGFTNAYVCIVFNQSHSKEINVAKYYFPLRPKTSQSVIKTLASASSLSKFKFYLILIPSLPNPMHSLLTHLENMKR